jgi:hypothetical protein
LQKHAVRKFYFLLGFLFEHFIYQSVLLIHQHNAWPQWQSKKIGVGAFFLINKKIKLIKYIKKIIKYKKLNICLLFDFACKSNKRLNMVARLTLVFHFVYFSFLFFRLSCLNLSAYVVSYIILGEFISERHGLAVQNFFLFDK